MRRSRRNGQLRRVSSWSLRVAGGDEDFLGVAAGPGDDPAERVGQKRAAPEFQAAAGGPFVADPVDGRDVHAVGDRVRPLDGLPGARLGRAELGLLGGVPADRRGVEQDLGPLKGRQPGGFGIPLVPADQGADAGERRVERLEAEVAGREVVLLVVERVVGDVHLAIEAAERAVGVEDDRRVVVDPGRAALEDRADDDHPGLSRDLAPAPRWSGPGSARPGRTARRPRPGRSTGCGTARAGRRPGRRGPRPARSIAHARRRLSSGSVEHRIWIRPTVNGRGFWFMAWVSVSLIDTSHRSVHLHPTGCVKLGRDCPAS